MKKVKVTCLEYKVLDHLLMSDFTGDGFGIGGYLSHDKSEFQGFDMNIYRGVLSSLTKKGVANFYPVDSDGMECYNGNSVASWGCVLDDFQKGTETKDDWELINIIYNKSENVQRCIDCDFIIGDSGTIDPLNEVCTLCVEEGSEK